LLPRVQYYLLFLLTGAAFIAVGAGLLYTLEPDSNSAKYLSYQVLVGIGVGTCIQIPLTVSQALSAPEDISVVTATVLCE